MLKAGEYELTLVPVQWEMAKFHDFEDHRYVAPARKKSFLGTQFQNNRNLSEKLSIYICHALNTLTNNSS